MKLIFLGRVLNHKEKTTIVYSLQKGILEHDIFSWQVFKDDVIKVEENTKASETIDKTLTNWIETTTDEQRKIFIDIIFDLFYSTNANNFLDLASDLKNNIPKILKKYVEISADDKKVLATMIIKLIKSNLGVRKNEGLKIIFDMKDEYINRLKKIKEKV